MPPSSLPLSRPAAPTTSFTSTTTTTTTSTPSQTPSSLTLHTHTHRHAPWTYIHLRLHQTTPTNNLDALTTRQYLTAALRTHLGTHGAATAVDILKVTPRTGDVWVRVPREDGAGVVAAVGGAHPSDPGQHRGSAARRHRPRAIRKRGQR
ncbi:hypothetical protein BK809_0000127 [Diplodia seriata]|uniref:Ribonucleases P/MRP subunit Pop8-like domain-containing protein n=1 Tax=Diplodia seriata TaxID=420778 RepID=A0A1S8BHF1_9PEZI|nr:hypothetical protein BK809_0000127 [Diplodia seriata]